VSSDAQFGLSPIALAAVVRITTNFRAFKVPSGIEEAFGFCADLLAQPHCQVVEPGERHSDIFRRLCIETQTRGARISDAALAIEWGAANGSRLDRDYARFPGLNSRRRPCHNDPEAELSTSVRSSGNRRQLFLAA
jgi:uncharacterized protein